MSEVKTMIALDCGNSSFRTVIGKYEDGKIESRVVDQTPNGMIRIGDYYYWDILRIFESFKNTMKDLIAAGERIDSIGICTWGIDFALFDKDGHMLSNPLAYRNVIGEQELAKLDKEERKALFGKTGILCDKINSVYMLSGMKTRFPKIMAGADRCLMVPDILNYFLTGEMMNEPSELSTTQIMSADTQKIEETVCEKFAIDPKLFGKIGKHGEKIGDVRADILTEIGADYEIPVICVPSHDTASAVAAIPAEEKRFGFISSGTWSLIGTELDRPICNDKVLSADLTNEVGAFGKITLLKNSTGMFIINRLKKEYDVYRGEKTSWDEVSRLADACREKALINLNDNHFFNPWSMSTAVWEYLVKTKQVTGELRWDVLFRAFYESLACCYTTTVGDLEEVTGSKFEKVYIVGGGTASRTLLDLTAQHMGKPIVACYGESTSIGNLAVQLKYFDRELDLKGIRKIIGESCRTREIRSNEDGSDRLEFYRKLIKEGGEKNE